MGRSKQVAGVCAGVLLTATSAAAQPSPDAALSAAAGHPVYGWSSQRTWDAQVVTWLGRGASAVAVADVQARVIHVGPWALGQLRKVGGTARGYLAAQDQAFALLALGHEAAHVEGVRDETAAYCEGWRRLPGLAATLGASRKQVVRMRDAVKAVAARLWLSRCDSDASTERRGSR